MNSLVFTSIFALASVSLACAATASAAHLKPEKVHVAEARKNQAYVKDGLIVGGDRAINDVVVKDIRRGKGPGFDRWVIDLEGNRSGEPAAIQRPPYYQVAVTPDEKRLVFTLWGSPKLGFNSKKVVAAMMKSPAIEAVELFPRVDDETWTFSINLKAGRPVEVFELSNPVRIIVDVKSDERKSQ